MSSKLETLLRHWHNFLGLPSQTPSAWHEERLREELEECRAARTSLEKLSERSDVFFTISRARHGGFPIDSLPPFTARNAFVYAYMVAKFTSRRMFYTTAAKLCKAPHYRSVREVVNPSRDHKLELVASRHGIDPSKFKRVGRLLRRVWPLPP
ncbi:MAG: hypothetical protein LQ340_003831 [Diploschistes diacapsis]|nr:MAG: hypothetical protein LQ340_003831 [Diploschistes diacapsis]